MLVAPLLVQLYVLLFGCSIVSQVLNPQNVAFTHSVPDGSLGGQARALAHFAQFPTVYVTRHLAAWTTSDFGNFETWFDDCDHCPDDWKRLTEQAHSRLEVPLENCDGSRNQAQEETEEVMSQVAMCVSMLWSCLLPLELLEAPLVDGQHPMAGFLRALHLCGLDTPGTLDTQLSCHLAIGFWISRPRDSSEVHSRINNYRNAWCRFHFFRINSNGKIRNSMRLKFFRIN